MILLIEPDIKVRKKICDLLGRERIIAIGTVSETLEMICKFRNRFNIIVANICQLNEIVSRGTLFRLCKKLCVDVPPILAFYKDGDEQIKKKFNKHNKHYKIIKYDEENSAFPELYINMVRELYPDVIAEIEKAKETWQRKETQDLIDPRKWLKEEGFIEPTPEPVISKEQENLDKIIPSLEKLMAEEVSAESADIADDEERDYKREFYELKGKYNELMEYVRELTDLVEGDHILLP